MKRLLAVCLFGGVLAGCSVQPITCDAAHPCAIGTCDTKHDPPICSLAQGACFPLCQKYEACLSGKCTPQGPAITSVNAPTTWSKRTGNVIVTAVVDGSQGPGISGATLKISGQQDVAGTTADTGNVRTYTFTVPTTVQAQASETPVNFTIVATDIDNRPTLPTGVGTGQLLIDDAPPSLVSGVTLVPAGVIGAGPIAWYKPGPGNIDAQVTIKDSGSGVDTSTLSLVSGGSRFDTPNRSCAQQTTKDTFICHFTISQAQVTAGQQKRFNFAVAGNDFAGNPVKVNTAALGLDGRPPTITFSVGPSGTTNYPAAGADCAGDVQACGHDGAHFWRAGDGKYKLKFIVSDTYASPVDDTGSGPDPTGGSCVIAGVATCTLTYDSPSGTFQFPAELGGATLASAADGTGNVSVTVKGKDMVGNPAADVTVTNIAVTRVKWVRKEAVGIATAPVLSTQLGLVIVGGVPNAGDSIFAVNTADGSQAWRAGTALPTIGTITGALALDTTVSTDVNHPTPILYANSGTDVFAMHLTTTGVDKFCSNTISANAAIPAAGSPIIFGGGASATVVAAAQDTFIALQTALKPTGNGCTQVGSKFTSTSPTFGPPAASGTMIYFGYDNHLAAPGDFGIKVLQFVAGVFSVPTVGGVNLGKQPTTNLGPAPISPASDLFYGVNGDHLFYRYKADLSASVWPSSPALASTANIFSQPLVVNSVVYGSADALYSYNAATGVAPATGWPIAANAGGQVSPPTIASNALFVADKSSPPKVNSFDLTGNFKWSYSPTGATVIGTIATEATIGPDGVLYFGDASGHIYALFSDGTPVAPGASDWPRTGYDNCNSNHGGSNPGFVCQ